MIHGPHEQRCVRALVQGRVQGVGFRWFVRNAARERALAGWVRNRFDGSVELEIQGRARDLESLFDALRRGPGSARVDRIDTEDLPLDRNRSGFEIKF
ncbi:MAG: acylphosphatase [Gemmatimonadetes bacterium]|nr:acylphosphatase [Gemmatimonadota bacterium]